jgi:hypothetical protein
VKVFRALFFASEMRKVLVEVDPNFADLFGQCSRASMLLGALSAINNFFFGAPELKRNSGFRSIWPESPEFRRSGRFPRRNVEPRLRGTRDKILFTSPVMIQVLYRGQFKLTRSSLVNTLPITKKNKHTVVTEAPKKVHVLLSR